MRTLTAVLVTYNHQDSVSRAFDSILEQKTDFEFDIFVLEDCSTDGTADVCREYQKKHPDKITLFLNEKNLGALRNYKQGLAKVTSKYFAFLDGDDYWCDEHKLQKQVDALEQNPDCTMSGHNTIRIDHADNEEWLFVGDSEVEIKSKYSIDDELRLHPSARVYRNIIDVSELPADMFYDENLYLLYLSRGFLFYIDEVMSVFNKTGAGVWSGLTQRERRILTLEQRYWNNKYLGFVYEANYYPKSRLLRTLKSVFGVEAGWFLFFRIEKLRLQIKYRMRQ